MLVLAAASVLWTGAGRPNSVCAGNWVRQPVATTDATVTKSPAPSPAYEDSLRGARGDQFVTGPPSKMRANASAVAKAWDESNYSDVSVWARAQNMTLKQTWKWVGCDSPGQNDQFDLASDRYVWWDVSGDASNYYTSDGRAAGQVTFNIDINTSPDNSGDLASSCDVHGDKNQADQTPPNDKAWDMALSLKWDTTQASEDLAWDDRADGYDDTFADSEDQWKAAPPIRQNLSNQGQSVVYVEITLTVYAKAEAFEDAEGGVAYIGTAIEGINLTKQ
jgi:hypothetical protein